MFNRFNHIFKLAVGVSVSVMLLGSCSEWTETESVEIHYPTLEEQNPALYEAYMQSLRDYRVSDHKAVFAKFDNKAAAPSGQAEHISSLPDSVDFVILNNPDNLSEAIVAEMKEIRENKGVKTLYTISYESFSEPYDAYLEKWNADHAEPEPEPEVTAEEGEGGETEEPETPQEPETPVEQPLTFDEFMGQQVDNLLAIADKYPYAGINVAYKGLNPDSLTEEKKAAAMASQGVFFGKIGAWLEAHPDYMAVFEGVPANVLVDNMFWGKCEYIIIDAIQKTNAKDVQIAAQLALTDAVRDKKIVMQVIALSVSNPLDTRGLFSELAADGNRKRAITGVAEWAVIDDAGFDKAGICIDNIEDDYFNILKSYKYTREAIAIMNPSPLK